MSLTGLTAIGSLISAVAVAVSWTCLALQMRQAEKNSQALIRQGARDLRGVKVTVAMCSRNSATTRNILFSQAGLNRGYGIRSAPTTSPRT